jgi:cytochrome c5
MYIGLLHSHKLIVTLFLLHYLIKTVLLFVNTEKAEAYTKKTKIPEMVLSFGFLVTGIGMWINMAEPAKTLFLAKIFAVFASIPLAVIGFKKKNKVLAVLSLVLLFGAYGLAEMSKKSTSAANIERPAGKVYSGVELYEMNCKTCHGADGTAGLSGAKNLQISTLSDTEINDIINNGKNSMPAYGKSFSKEEISSLVEYTKTLRK